MTGASAPATSDEAGWLVLVCRAAWDETHDVRTFVLARADGSAIAFEPGQFMTLRAHIGGAPVERCYTLASSAAVSGAVAITVKRKPGGRMSTHLHATLGPGARIEAHGPTGAFGPGEDSARRWLLISGGSGITPMAAIVRTAADLGTDLDAVFVHAARSPRDVIFADEFARLSRRLPRLRVHLVASRTEGAAWTGESGRIDAAMLARAVPDLAARHVLCCGPEGFMATVRGLVSPTRYAEESFDFGAPPAAPVATEGVTRRIAFARSGKSFDCPPGATILEAARAAGVPMPSSCGKGVCGTCKSRKLSGIVTMAHGGGIRQREIDQGMILPCSSRPDSDVTLDR